MNCLFKPRGVGKSELLNWLAVLISAPPQPPNPPSPRRGEGGLTISRFLTLFYLVQDFGFIFVVFTQKCIVDDICDAGARFFTFPPAGSTNNKRVGKVTRLSYPIFLLGGGRGSLKLTYRFLVLYFSYSPESVSLTTYVTVTVTGAFFHFPPGGVHKQKGW
jgi:hypothetical protein